MRAHAHATEEGARGSCSVARVTSPEAATPPLIIKVPRSVNDVDNGRILGFDADLSADHPGFHDGAYKARRTMLSQMANAHVIGAPIAAVDYTAAERAVWATVLRQLRPLLARHACAEYLRSLPLFGFSEDRVPQLEEAARVLRAATGWGIRPVAGLMHPRDFLAGLAFKTFHSTQYIRHASQPGYTPEPDLVHELIGHVPLLADPGYASMVEAIGRASLGADDKTIWHLTKVYWYTVEFGVVREGSETKAFGSGILSSTAELAHMASGAAALQPLDPFAPLPKMSYKDGVQPRYFLLESFECARQQLCDYAASVRLPEELRGDASLA
ncbi:hypothetical protein FOA52_001804 [Chlamydomonas sp. UWO 241]|nr:hypothetical protein FOA52_009256 [Chlamydomonas sp. UWO 241]KAG1675505.1 hypothetical protein FOA52_001804 [Chlamydomonas sp. UWO 241]